MTAIALNQVCLDLGGRRILSDVTIEIGRQEFIGVLGANGAGKTSLMRTILGLLIPRSGRVEVLGRPATRGNAAIGYVPQSRPAIAGLRLSGWDVVASGVNSRRPGWPWLGHTGTQEVAWALEQVDATALARRTLGDLSGGERQRLLLAQALVSRPRLLLLDEPLISLDPHHQHAVVALVRRLSRELGIAVLFSAHDLNPLLGAIDRVLYLGGGRAALGTVEEVVSGPMLSRLYGAPIEVVRLGGHIFVMAGETEAALAHV